MQNKLDYGELLSPYPLKLTIGTINKPTLEDIAKISFAQYDVFRYFMVLTPESYYCEVKSDSGGKELWEAMTLEQQEELTIFNILKEDEQLQSTFAAMFNFFFNEEVIYGDGVFLLLKEMIKPEEDINVENLRGYINETNFDIVLGIVKQFSCVKGKTDEEDVKFKNDLARSLYERMKKSQKKEEEKANKDLTIPNIISSVSNRHPSLNITNIWRLTMYQLLDAFERLRTNAFYDISSLSVSVWGDEKKQFKDNLWYQNNFDK